MNQVEVLYEFWPTDGIDWFVIGGPADQVEAQTVKGRYPDVRCIGFEPNSRYCDLQNGKLVFPGKVHRFALWSANEVELTLSVPERATPQSGSVCRPAGSPDVGNQRAIPVASVTGRTLDSLSAEFGPFTNAALWLDIEYAELEALKGARDLLASGHVRLINLETFAHVGLPAIVNLLCGEYCFQLVKVWNIGTVAGRDAQDYVFARGSH